MTALLAALVANALGQSFLFVVLPPLGRRLGLTDVETGMVLSLSALVLLISAPIWGFASERIGRRRVLLIALISASIAPIVIAIIVSERLAGETSAFVALVLLIGTRIGWAAGAGGLLPAAQAYVADVSSPALRARGMGLLGAAYGVGSIGGAALAWRLGGGQPVLAFGIVGAVVLAGLVAVAIWVSEPSCRVDVVPQASLRASAIWSHLVITALGIFVYAIVQQVTALRLQDVIGLSSAEATAKAGSILTAAAFAMIAMQAVGLRFLTWTPKRLILTGAGLAALAALLLVLVTSFAPMLAATALLGAALGLMLPGNIAALSLKVGPHAQGTAAGLNAVAQGIGLAVGPVTGAALHGIHHTAPFLAAALALAITICVALLPQVDAPNHQGSRA